MPTYTGKDCVVTVGGTVVGKMKQVSWNGTREFQSDRYMGEEGEDHSVGSTGYEGSLTYHHDPGDAGQTAIDTAWTNETILAVVVHPIGDSSGDPTVSFSAWVADDPNNLEIENKAEKTRGLRIQGIPTKGTVPT